MHDEDHGDSTVNRAGDVHGNVVQAGSVNDVHFHAPQRWVLIALGGVVVLLAAVVTAVVLSGRETAVAIQGTWQNSCGWYYYPASAAGSVLASRSGLRGVPGEPDGRSSNYDVRITAQVKGSGDVVLTGMRVVDLRRDPPPTSGILASETCGGPMAARSFEVDLDRPNPVPKPVAVNDMGREDIPAVPFPFRVAVGDPEVFDVLPVWKRPCDCRFSVEIDWVVRGEPGTTRVDNGGAGFRLVLGSTLPRHRWDDLTRAWVIE